MGQLVGYLKINWGSAQTENQQNNSLEIERIYVLDKFHGNQFGQKLLEVALHMSKEKAVDYVWLGVWEHNSKAIHFYQKNKTNIPHNIAALYAPPRRGRASAQWLRDRAHDSARVWRRSGPRLGGQQWGHP